MRLCLLGLALVALACSDRAPASASRRTEARDRPAPADLAALTFELPTPPTRGSETFARVTVTATPPWHLNVDFPVALRLRSDRGIALASTTLRTIDAERYDDDALVFAIPLTVHACGEHTIEGDIDFAVCDEATCAPTTKSIALAVAAC